VESSTTCGFGFKDTIFKIVCSTCAWWIFPRLVDFLMRNLKIMWTDKDLKGEENIKRRDRGNG